MPKSLSRTDDEIARLYERHVKTVWRVCFAYLKNNADTEDAVSETFVKMLRKAPVFDGTEHEKAWLIRTASNVCKDFLKHPSRRSLDIADWADTLKAEEGTETGGLLEAVLALPDRYKTAVHLYYYEGYTSVQIAALLRKPQSTVRNYLSEARNILRERLGENYNEE